MSAWFRTAVSTVSATARRFPLLMGAVRIMNKKAQSIREFRNIQGLLAELHPDVALQLPQLVEQNRNMFREIKQLKAEVARLRNLIEKR